MVRTVRKGLKGYLEDVSTDYTFTGDVENTVADVDVKYGSHFTAETAYSYEYGKKTNMVLSVSHGQSARPYETEYTYDAIGRLSGKERAMTGTGKSLCSYTYDVHGWLTGINSGGFQEQMYYTDGLDGGYYNGNISTVKWKRGDYGPYQGYNLKYDGSNRLTSAVFGEGDNLTSYKNYYDEYAEYDCNGNITRMNRRGLVDNMHGGFGFVDNLRMTYEGNMLTSVRDNATRQSYAGAADFDGVTGQEYPLTYNGAGSLVSDAGRGIARIGYDPRNNPVRIQFTDGNVTKYIYSATGEKLRVVYQTAVLNVSVAIGSARELSPSEILSADSVDCLLGGRLTLRNGRIDRFQFDEGYCQAKRYTYNHSQDDFIFYYYDRDHLGNIRQVVKGSVSNTGNVVQSMDYYPFGAQFCDGSTDNNFQSRRYNGKEFDGMHGLNTYDYGARQYNPVTARWDRVDPLCEKYYSISPYAYCGNNPIMLVDPDGLFPTGIITIHNERTSLATCPSITGVTLTTETQLTYYTFTKSATHLLSLVSGVSEEYIGKVRLEEFGGQKKNNCITLGSNPQKTRMLVSPTYFDESNMSSGQYYDWWFREFSHEVGHIKQIERDHNMGIYLLKTVYGYVKTMSHDEAPREKEAEEGSTVYMKFRKFVKDVFKKDLTTLFTGKDSEEYKIDQLDKWWNSYKKQER